MNSPITIASDTLVEAIARALCEQHIREVRRWDTEPAKLEAMLPAAIDYSWQDHVALAQAALTAITQAGYAVVPIEPSATMDCAMEDVLCSAEDCTCDHIEIYRAAISATNTGKGGE